MKNLLDWIRTNIITTISIALTLVAIGLIVVYGFVKGQTFQGQMQERGDKIQDISQFSEQTISIPSEDPNEPPVQKRGQTIKDAMIRMKKRINQKMRGQLEGTLETATQINRANHQVLIEGMFPDPNNQQAFDARDAYIRAFGQMRQALDAETPPSEAQRQKALNNVRAQYLQSNRGSSTYQQGTRGGRRRRTYDRPGQANRQLDLSTLADADLKRMREDLRQRLMSLLRNRARAMHIYAAPVRLNQQGRFNQDMPFDIGTWAYESEAPRDWQLWEAQLELWIQQDIVRALAKANQTDNDEMSVINAPVKRLLNIQVIPGYVGLQTVGGVNEIGSTGNRNSYRSASNSNSNTSRDRGYPPPAGGQTGDPNQPLSGNYYLSHTGRGSNSIYDVRHVRVDMVADVAQLPAVFDALAQVNFMTVLDLRTQNVNEYAALREGYVYGQADAARVTLIIETLWLRNWTEDLMPDRTKISVGAAPAPESEQGQAGQPYMGEGEPYMGPEGEPY